MISWHLKLDEAAGVVDVSLDDLSMRYRAAAIYRPDKIRFELLDASFSIDRANGAIKRTLIEYGVANVAEGTCSLGDGAEPASKKANVSQTR